MENENRNGGSDAVSAEHTELAFRRLAYTERVVLVLDTSPSMEQRDYSPTRLEAAKNAAKAFIDKKLGIDDRDEVAIVSFSGTAKKRCALRRVGKHRRRLVSTVASLKCGWLGFGGTAIGEALKEAAKILGVSLDLAKRVMEPGSPYVCRIVILSDGENNVGAEPVEVASRLKAAGVVIDTVGIGEASTGKNGDGLGLNIDALMTIASTGRYQYISDAFKLVKHLDDIGDKVLTGVPDRGIAESQERNPFVRVGQIFAGAWFTLFHVHRLKAGSPHIGQYCLNERDEGSKFREGELVVICPKCGLPQHIDCWIWNGSCCYGGNYPCPGKGTPLSREFRKRA